MKFIKIIFPAIYVRWGSSINQNVCLSNKPAQMNISPRPTITKTSIRQILGKCLNCFFPVILGKCFQGQIHGSNYSHSLFKLIKWIFPAIYIVWGSSRYQDVDLSNKPKNFKRMNCGTLFIQAILGKGFFQAILGKCSQGGFSRSLFIPEKDTSINNYPLHVSGRIITNQTNPGIIHRIFPQPDMAISNFLQNRVKIILFIIQWPTNKIATQGNSQDKIKQSTLQWPPKKGATPLKNVRDGPYTVTGIRNGQLQLNGQLEWEKFNPLGLQTMANSS